MSQGTYNYDPRIATIRHDRPMSSGEIGCFLSHVKALELFLDGTEKYAIILKDDADLPEGIIAKIVAIAQRLDTEFPENWDSFNFSAATKGYQYPVNIQYFQNRTQKSLGVPTCLVAYQGNYGAELAQ